MRMRMERGRGQQMSDVSSVQGNTPDQRDFPRKLRATCACHAHISTTTKHIGSIRIEQCREGPSKPAHARGGFLHIPWHATAGGNQGPASGRRDPYEQGHVSNPPTRTLRTCPENKQTRIKAQARDVRSLSNHYPGPISMPTAAKPTIELEASKSGQLQ